MKYDRIRTLQSINALKGRSAWRTMDIGPLLGLWFQTLVVGLTMHALSICIFLVTYGRMIEIYAVTALGRWV